MEVDIRVIRHGLIVAAVATAIGGSGLLAAGASADGLASESPQQVVSAAVSAMKGAKGYEMHFNMHHPDMVGTLIDAGNGKLAMTFEQNNSGTASVILAGGKVDYLKASVKFWTEHGSSKSLAKLLAPKWYKVPKSEFGGLAKSLNQIAPAHFAQCAASGHGALSNLGASTVDGQPVVIIRDAGGKPGTAPGTIAIASTGKAYPIRLTSTGPTLAGGPVNSCSDGKASKTTGVVTITNWNKPPAVSAPAHAVALPTSSKAGA
jgi:hypothetical protein